MAKASRKQKKPSSAEFWRKHVEGWRASKLTQAEYCRRHNLSAGAFLSLEAALPGAKRRCFRKHAGHRCDSGSADHGQGSPTADHFACFRLPDRTGRRLLPGHPGQAP